MWFTALQRARGMLHPSTVPALCGFYHGGGIGPGIDRSAPYFCERKPIGRDLALYSSPNMLQVRVTNISSPPRTPSDLSESTESFPTYVDDVSKITAVRVRVRELWVKVKRKMRTGTWHVKRKFRQLRHPEEFELRSLHSSPRFPRN